MASVFDLYEHMKQNGEYLYDYRLPEKQKSIIIKENGKYAVFIDTEQIESIAEETAIIAHEIGHCETGSTHAINSPYDLIARHEYRADKWAAYKLLPPAEIKKAMFAGNTETWQLAEYFNLPEKFIVRVLKIYEVKNAL